MKRPCRSDTSNSGAIGDDHTSAHHASVMACHPSSRMSGSAGISSFGSAFNVAEVETLFLRALVLDVFGNLGTINSPIQGLGIRTQQFPPASRVLRGPP